jgi:hypothetical protein
MTDTSFAIVLPSGRENRKMHLLEKQEILNCRENDESIFLNKKKKCGECRRKDCAASRNRRKKKGKKLDEIHREFSSQSQGDMII